MPIKVLNADWTDYDKRKIEDKRDSGSFSCTVPWEVTYLINKIQSLYGGYSEENIRKAINYCCTVLSTNHPRKHFVECVMTKLRSV